MNYKQIHPIRGKGYICSFVLIADESAIQYLYCGNSFFGMSHLCRHKKLTKDTRFYIYLFQNQ